MVKRMLCKDCVNFISHEEGVYHCDFEHWVDTPYKDALLNCGEMFECENYENLSTLK